jgi:hypothetical protein
MLMLTTSLITLNVIDDVYFECISLCQVSLHPSTNLPATGTYSSTHLGTDNSSKTSRSRFRSTVPSSNLYQPVRSARHCKLSCSCSFFLKCIETIPKIYQVSPTAIITYDHDIKHRKDKTSSIASRIIKHDRLQICKIPKQETVKNGMSQGVHLLHFLTLELLPMVALATISKLFLAKSSLKGCRSILSPLI